MRGYYQTVRSFDFAPGGNQGAVSGAAFHGGGFGFVIDLSDVLGLYTDSTFLTGVDSNYLQLKLFNQVQGFRATARDVGPVNVYAKAGMGFARWEVNGAYGSGIAYKMSFEYGGGIDAPLSDNLFLFGEFKGSTFALPQLTAFSNRQKWQTSPVVMTGIGIRF